MEHCLYKFDRATGTLPFLISQKESLDTFHFIKEKSVEIYIVEEVLDSALIYLNKKDTTYFVRLSVLAGLDWKPIGSTIENESISILFESSYEYYLLKMDSQTKSYGWEKFDFWDYPNGDIAAYYPDTIFNEACKQYLSLKTAIDVFLIKRLDFDKDVKHEEVGKIRLTQFYEYSQSDEKYKPIKNEDGTYYNEDLSFNFIGGYPPFIGCIFYRNEISWLNDENNQSYWNGTIPFYLGLVSNENLDTRKVERLMEKVIFRNKESDKCQLIKVEGLGIEIMKKSGVRYYPTISKFPKDYLFIKEGNEYEEIHSLNNFLDTECFKITVDIETKMSNEHPIFN